MQIIKERERKTIISYELSYIWNDCPGAGFGFPCTRKGLLLPMQPAALENFVGCITGKYNVSFEGIKKNVHTYTEPAILKCDCGSHVRLHGFTNTCDNCERDYNMSGQLLANRSQWGEETGEQWYECY